METQATLLCVNSPHGTPAPEIEAAPQVSYLESVLVAEFVGAKVVEGAGKTEATNATLADSHSKSTLSFSSESVQHQTICSRIVSSVWFTSFFMVLTFYALFAPDIDQINGDRSSQDTLTAITTVVVAFFALEIALHCVGKKGYVFGAYFWLDIVSLISLLPDTLILQAAYSEQNLAAGRSSRLTRIIRVATRSSKAARLNRLSRIVRVAALMPRLQRLLGGGVKDEATEKLLDKKLGRIFSFLDEDLDGFVGKDQAMDTIQKLGRISGPVLGATWASKTAGKVGSSVKEGTSSLKSMAKRVKEIKPAGSDATSGGEPTLVPQRRQEHRNAVVDDGLISYPLFKQFMDSDEAVSAGMRRACQYQIRNSNNMQNLTSKNSEYIGVKVALCVLLLLFVLTFVETSIEDYSESSGLQALDGLMRSRYPNATTDERVPPLMAKQVMIWTEAASSVNRKILYLDLNRMSFCSEIAGRPCAPPNLSSLTWGPRRMSLDMLDQMTKDHHRRWQDLVWIRYPTSWDSDYSLDQLDEVVTAVALIDKREGMKKDGEQSVAMTVVVILIILIGIWLLARDLTFLSVSLLVPLVDLAEEMESITRLQLSGVSRTAECQQLSTGTSEVRLIRRTFENMKTAIKSWGKYVPWPVVQLLLRAGVEAGIDVQEKNVSIYFSDIAGFTTIVEGLPPVRSLLLLSRYFHDMSKVIDDHQGIVLEFIGDAIMAIYGAPVRNLDHASSAVQAAIKMLAALKNINVWSATKQLPQMNIRCGVHTGEVLVGNMGFASRMKYGAVGEHSNVPGHLEESNKNYDTEMMISEATYQSLKDPSLFITRPIDVMVLIPEEAPVWVYQVQEKSPQDVFVQEKIKAAKLHTEAMGLYRAQNFKEAAAKFEAVREILKDATGNAGDTPSSMLLKRCLSYMESPPPAKWDGLWDRGAVK